MTLLEAKAQIIHIADVRRHMEFAGFRKATSGNRWYCAFHDDSNASCTIRNNKCHCWSGCNRLFDIIEIEQLSTGESFVQVVKRLCKDYGLELDSKPQDPSRQLSIQQAWMRDTIQASLWKIAMVSSLRVELEENKRILFPFYGVNEEAACNVRTLTAKLTAVTKYSPNRLVQAYREFRMDHPKLASAMVKWGQDDDKSTREITAICCGFLEAASMAKEDQSHGARHPDVAVDGGQA